MTTIATLQHANCFQAEILPNTIHEAVEIMRMLEFKRLWINALCIIEDDAFNIAIEIEGMSSVYGCSALTLCAAKSANVKNRFASMTFKNQIHSPPKAPGWILHKTFISP